MADLHPAKTLHKLHVFAGTSEAVRAYALIAGMWVRAAMAYRATFAMLTIGQFIVTGLDFAAIWIMFSHTPQLGGFDLAEVGLLYGASGIAIGFADLLVGGIEQTGQRLRDGSFDTMLVRPVRAFVQAAADRFALRRLGRVTQGTVVFCWALTAVDVDWTWDRVLLVPLMVVSGTVIFVGIFTLGAAFQFAATDAAEVSNAFTYGGNTLTQYPPTIFAKDLVRAVTFTIPLAFVNWMPVLYRLDKPSPIGLPPATGFASPLAAALLAGVAALAWRTAVRSYRSTGS